MKHRFRKLAIWAAVLTAALPLPARAYVLEGVHWPAGPIVMNLQLGAPDAPLRDGSTNWNQVVKAAMSVWNPYLGSVQLVPTENATPAADSDGLNSIFFSDTVYGDDFGGDTLGITLYTYDDRNVALEADVIFNTAKPYDSYRGNLQYVNGSGLLYDLRRVAIHEFGHVLGLDHVPQRADSVMAPSTTNLDTVAPDDINGVQSLYGVTQPAAPEITSALTANASPGVPFTYQIEATGAPTAFTAVGLPAGLSLASATGIISGTTTAEGTYRVSISARNGIGSTNATLTLTVSNTAIATVEATTPSVVTGSGEAGVFTVSLPAAQSGNIVVRYKVSGNAINGTDYEFLKGTVKIKAGQTSKAIKIKPLGDLGGEAQKTVKIKLVADSAYTLGASKKAKVLIVAGE